MITMNPYLRLAIIVTAIKLLLIPSYRSTDFEVHRNWLAITHSLPLSKWYYEDTSVWTLDYPPLFSWFEWILSQAAKYFDENMLVISNLGYASDATVLFQRGTVIITDVVFILAAYKLARQAAGAQRALLTFLLVVCNAGLLLVDHVHFQYNGILTGVLLWSVWAMQQQRDLLGGILFAVLLNMKHLYAYAAPVYFVYILRHYCVGRTAVLRFLAMGAAVAAVCGASFGPFVLMGQLGQVLSRLFPFGRGLCHAYWAANFWAVYSCADKVLAVALPKFLGIHIAKEAANMAGGLVGVARFAVLPQISPQVTMGLVLLALVPCLVSLAKRPQPQRFAAAVAYSYLCGFVFGYHVHEKAALMAVLPLALLATRGPRQAADFLVLSTSANYGLFPLLFQPQEYLIKLLIVTMYGLMAWWGLSSLHCKPRNGKDKAGSEPKNPSGHGQALLSCSQAAYILGFVALEVYASWVHPWTLGDRLPFVPLLLTSVYCSVGVLWVWARMAWCYLTSGKDNDH